MPIFRFSYHQICIAAALAALVLLAGCSAPGAATITTIQAAFFSNSPVDSTPLRPGLSYLRIQQSGNIAILVLGEIDSHPQGPIEVWYSAQREVIRLQNGRLVGTAGLSTNWSYVSLTPTDRGFKRVRDLMPDYLSGLQDNLIARKLNKPPSDLVKRLKNPQLVLTDDVQWIEEISDRFHELGPSFIAYGKNKEALAGHTCLTATLCLSWERLQ